jgi:peroxiredoxin
MDPLAHTPALLFELPDLQGQTHRLADQLGRVVVLNFWSAECPWCKRTDREIESYLKDWGDKVIYWSIACNANEPVELLAGVAQHRNLPVLLVDETQSVADLYQAHTTPHVFVIDPQGMLIYQGAVDDVTFRQRIATRHYLHEVVEATLRGQPAPMTQTPAYGCTIVRRLA